MDTSLGEGDFCLAMNSRAIPAAESPIGYVLFFFINNDRIQESNHIIVRSYLSTVVQLPEKFISYKPGRVVSGETFTFHSNATGENVTSTAESNAEVFNEGNVAIGNNSHAEGIRNIAFGEYSHAEGFHTEAFGAQSHSEGYMAIAGGIGSHAEGCDTFASGVYSHAEGERTIAAGQMQHVQGKYNVEDVENKYAHIVGNGIRSFDGAAGQFVENRSNAHTLDWNGNGWYASDILYGGTSQDDATSVKSKIESLESQIATLQNTINSLLHLPAVTADNNGQLLQVVDGVWTAVTIPNAEDASF